MGKEISMLGDIQIEKNQFWNFHYESPIFLRDVNIENVLVSNKISFSEKNYKYFISYLYDDYKFKPLHIMLPKTKAYVKIYDGQTEWMIFLIKTEDLLNKYNIIWDKVISVIKKKSDSKPVCNNIFWKTKITSYGDDTTNFHNKEMSKAGSDYTCLAVDSALKKDKNYDLQAFLKECKCIEKEVIRNITEDIEVSSSDSDEE